MSNLRKHFNRFASDEKLNSNLYVDGTIANGTYEIKEDILNNIMGMMDWDIDAYNPEEEFNATGKIELNKLSLNDLSEDDIHYLQEDLNDSELVKNDIKEIVDSSTEDGIAHTFYAKIQNGIITIDVKLA